MIKKISIITLGCAKNEIDSELMISILRENNYIITSNLEDADVIIVNTCGFILDAKEESIETILEMAKYKKQGKCKYLILAGCLAERYSEELTAEIEEIDGIIGTGNIKDIVNLIEKLEIGNEKIIKIHNVDEDYLEDINRVSFRTTEYVRISEGCNNHCSYCIIPKLRGKYRSRTMESIVSEVKYLVDNGVKEIILIGQNTTDYGIDIYGEYNLNKLLDELNKIENLKWIRILYLYPDNFTDELIISIKNNEKVVKYVDIPLQHINNKVLKGMNRKTSKEEIKILINKLRNEIPNIIIRTTFIVGFPGETEEDFNELCDFVREIKFDKLGVFTYSREEGTASYNYQGQIPDDIKESRRNQLMEIQQRISYNLNKEKLNNDYLVLIESFNEDNLYIGRTYMDAPDIDGIIYINSNKDLILGEFVNTKIVDYLEYDLIGEISNEFSE